MWELGWVVSSCCMQELGEFGPFFGQVGIGLGSEYVLHVGPGIWSYFKVLLVKIANLLMDLFASVADCLAYRLYLTIKLRKKTNFVILDF